MTDEAAVERQVSRSMRDTCWLNYCIFGGSGLHCKNKCAIHGAWKCLFCKGYHSSSQKCCDDEDGMCMSFNKTCCIVTANAFPPGGSSHDGIPCCAICNQRCGGEEDDEDDDRMSKNKRILKKTFLCYALPFLGACGLARFSKPLVMGKNKVCCVMSQCQTATMMDETGCCYSKNKTCCFTSGAVFPPGGSDHDGLPVLACLGMTCLGAEDEQDSDENEFERPMQQEMEEVE